jgi:hypothetical protein
MYKLRLIVFVAVVSSMFIYWWRTDRSHVRVPVPAIAVTADDSPSATAPSTRGIGTNGTSSPPPHATVTTGTGTSGAAAAPTGDTNSDSRSATTGGATRAHAAPAGGGGKPQAANTGGAGTTRGTTASTSAETRIVAAGYGAIGGTVRDASGGALSGAGVRARKPGLFAKTWSATTDGTGRYTLNGLPEGTYTVTFSGARHASATREVVVRPDQIVQSVDAVLTRAD